MSANVINWHAKAGRAIGIGAIDYTPARIGQTLHIPCARGHRVDVEIKSRMAPEMLGKKLLHAGWTIGNHLLCPKHSKKKQAPAPAPQEEIEDMALPQNVTPLPTAAPPATSDAARSAKRAAMQWLDEAFDVTKGQFSPGVSDETIAKETGLAAAKVKELREEFYGALKEPSELQACRAEIEALRKLAEAKVDELRLLTNQALGAIVRDLDNAVARIESLAKLNGWRA